MERNYTKSIMYSNYLYENNTLYKNFNYDRTRIIANIILFIKF